MSINTGSSSERKLKCKHCQFMAPDMKELRIHVRGKHKEAWALHRQQMEAFDHMHESELSPTCTICAHRRPSHEQG